MPRSGSIHVCSVCGHESPRWAGQCPGCGEWNTLVEEARPRFAPVGAGGRGGGLGSSGRAAAVTPVPLVDIEATEETRIATGIGELDSVLGGGIVPGSLIL